MLASPFFKLTLIVASIVSVLGSPIAYTIAFTTVVDIPPAETSPSGQATPTATPAVAYNNTQVQGGAVPDTVSVVSSSDQAAPTPTPAVTYNNTQAQGEAAPTIASGVVSSDEATPTVPPAVANSIISTTQGGSCSVGPASASTVLSSDQVAPTVPPAVTYSNTQGGTAPTTTSAVLSSDQAPPFPSFTSVSKAGSPIYLGVPSESEADKQHTSTAAVDLSSIYSSSAARPTSTASDVEPSIYIYVPPPRPMPTGTGIMGFWW